MTIAAENSVTTLILSPEDRAIVDRLRQLTGLRLGQALRLAAREAVAAREDKPTRRRRT